MTFAVGIALFGALGYFIQPWRSLAIAANSSGVLFFLLSVWVKVSDRWVTAGIQINEKLNIYIFLKLTVKYMCLKKKKKKILGAL